MASYVVLFHFTEQGVKHVRDSPKRAAAFRESAEKHGAEVREIFWTLGAYDGVIVVEAPDDESITALMLGLGALGNVRSQTLRAFDRAQFEGVIAKMA